MTLEHYLEKLPDRPKNWLDLELEHLLKCKEELLAKIDAVKKQIASSRDAEIAELKRQIDRQP